VSRKDGVFRPMGICLLIALCLNQGVAVFGTSLGKMWHTGHQGPDPRTEVIRDFWNLTPKRLREATAADERTMSVLRLSPKAREMIGDHTVDVWSSFDLSIITANPSLNYRPRPIFQQIAAFTSNTDRINANFFKSASRPDFLFLWNSDTCSIDNRHMLFEDPIQQLEILNSYEVASVETWPLVILLRHKEGRRFADPVVF